MDTEKMDFSLSFEAATKPFGSDLLISETIANEISHQFSIKDVGEVDIKGVDVNMHLYKCDGYFGPNGEFVKISTPYSDFDTNEISKVKVVGS